MLLDFTLGLSVNILLNLNIFAIADIYNKMPVYQSMGLKVHSTKAIIYLVILLVNSVCAMVYFLFFGQTYVQYLDGKDHILIRFLQKVIDYTSH